MKVDGYWHSSFESYCRYMYDENCYERWHHGQKPYNNQEEYVERNKEWLKKQYKNANKV
tara:strand:- start:4 stop:180 length:177 start_codon:yes stop_codon:yes gene_type:complete